MQTDDVTIDLDRKTRAIRSGTRWAVQRLRPDGHYDLLDAWDGSRRSLFQWCDRNGVHPSREAEARLDQLAEGLTFRERL